MTEASQDFIHELLRRLHHRFDKAEHADRERRAEIASLRMQMHAMFGEIHDIRGSMARLQDRLELIERRLELRDFQEMAQMAYDEKAL